MCGTVPVSMRNHDVEFFVEQGVNGFYGDSPQELAEYVSYLVENEAAWKKMSERARATAVDTFNHDRFLTRWTELLNDAL